MARRRNFSRCVIGLPDPDCLMGACRHYEREKGCGYEPPEPAGKLGLQRRQRPSAAGRPMPEPEKAA